VKLKELNEQIAAACEMTPRAVANVQAETFRRIDAALARGERVHVPDFGIFSTKEVAAEDGQPASRSVRFRRRDDEDGRKSRKKRAKEETSDEAKTDEAAE
jgi:nucleoid DNA-binding protein